MKTYTDAMGNVTRYEYNRNYQTVKVTDALGGSTTTSYDALGRVTSTTDAEGNTTTYTYDANGNVLTVTDALGNSVTYTYDNRGRTATAKDKLGSVTTYAYDARGNVTSTTDAAGRETKYAYDALGNLAKSTNRMNESVSYTYDSMSRRIKEKNELNQTREYAYDAAGNLVSVTDGNRHVTTYTYDKLSRLTSEENAEGGIAEYTYDYLGNMSTYTVYGGNNERATTAYTYDAAGNLTKETSPLGYTTSYAYDANGNVTSRTDENGTETTYEYDALGRLIKREDRDGQVQYTYDKVGNVTSATNDAGTVSFAYDELYRTVKVTNEDNSETTYTYDAAGNRMSITYPDGKAVTTAYDELGRVLSLTDHDGTGILYTRDAEGRITKESYTDGSTTEYTYNAAGLLTLQKEVTKDNETLRQIAYTYDDAGNLTSENRSGVGIERKDELVRYYYDKADQLVKTNIEGVTKEYAYDKAGNLTSDGESAYTYDLQNRLITKTNTDGTTTYTYDKAGNLTREIAPDGITNYTYSAQNKLVKGEKTNGESSTYVYNALGVRIANTQVRTNKNAGNQNADLRDGSHGLDYMRFLKNGRASWQRAWETEIGTTVQSDKETVTRHYVVDYLSIANRDIFVTEDGSYATRYVYDAGGRRISAEFDYAPGTKRGEAGENLQSDIAVSIGKVFYRTSILGSTLFAVDKDGNLIAHAIYDPWGKPLTETYTDSNYSGFENLNNYTGYTYDLTLALYFAQNRFYDAETHRFTQEDAAKDGANWYVYCGNEPTLRVDWDGNFTIFRGIALPSEMAGAIEKVEKLIKNKIEELKKHLSNPLRRKDLYAGFAVSLAKTMIDSGAVPLATVLDFVNKLTGRSITSDYYNAYIRGSNKLVEQLSSMVKYQDSFYFGKSLGDVAVLVIGIYKTIEGVGKIIGGVIDAIAGVVAGAAETATGAGAVAAAPTVSAAISTAIALVGEGSLSLAIGAELVAIGQGNLDGDLEKYNYYSKLACESNNQSVSWTAHGYKHFPNKNMSWEKIVASTKNGPAKYSPKIPNIEQFEREAWRTGRPVSNGKNWKVKKYNSIIGAVDGHETQFVRIENSGGVIHGHPISESEYLKLIS